MGYFRELPDLEYLSPLSDRNSSSEYITVKNIFKRVKLREDIQGYLTLFNKYVIKDGDRPDNVAEELYGDPTLDWVVLISSRIINVRNQWPLSDKDIFLYSEKIYEDSLNQPRFYETKEVKDSKGRLILPEGLIVDKNFKSPRPETDNEPNTSYVKFYDSGLKLTITKYNIVNSVTNYEYETRKNDKKRTINVLKRGYLQQFLNDSRKIMLYSESTQYLNDKLKRGDNIRVKSP
jgi:hypothetical protein